MTNPIKEPVQIGPQYFLSDVRILEATLVFTTLTGPASQRNWEYARSIVHDHAEPVQLLAYHHIRCEATDNPEYEEYATTVACNPHADHPFIASEGAKLLGAWLLPSGDPKRIPRVVAAMERITSDLQFYLVGVSSYVEVPEDASDEDLMLAVLDRFEEAEVAMGERPPAPSQEHLAPDEDQPI